MPRPRIALAAAVLPCLLLGCGSEPRTDEVMPRSPAEETRPSPEEVDAAIHTVVDPLMADGWVPGLAVALVDREGVRFFAFGDAGMDGVAIDSDTVFEIGSITKLFTAFALDAMAERGEVALDEPLGALLPEGTQLPAEGGDAITLLDLATHYSGLAAMPDNFMPADPDNPFVDYGPDQLYAYLAGATLDREPGSAFAYSNLGFGLLGHALTLRAGQDYAALLSGELLEPLSMTDTGVEVATAAQSRTAGGHDADGEPRPAWDFGVLAPAGAVRSTLRDMSRFAGAALGTIDTPLRAQFDRVLAPRRDQPQGAIGLGWLISPFDEHWHNGQTGGYHSFIGLDRERQVAVILLASAAAPVVDPLGFAMLDIARGTPPMPLSVPTTVELPPENLDQYAGRYELSPELTLEVRRERDTLRLQVADDESFRLWPSGDDDFYLRAVPAVISFTRGENGDVTGLALAQDGRRLVAPRL